MIAGTLELQLMADVARLRQDMAQAKGIVSSTAQTMQQDLEKVKSMFGALFAGIGTGAILGAMKQVIDFADSLDDLSKSTSIAVEKLAGLRWAAKIGGSDLAELAKGIHKLQMEMGKAPEKFAAIGITAKDNVGALKQMADLFNSIEDPQLRAAVAAEALGKGWSTVAPLLSRGGDEIEKLIKRGEELYGITQANSDIAGDFNDAIDELLGSLQGLMLTGVQGVLPMLTELIKQTTELTLQARNGGDGFGVLGTVLQSLIVVGGNVAFVLRGIGTEMGGILAQADAVARGDLAGAATIRKEMIADAEKARAAFDAWETKMMSFGKAAQQAVKDQEALKMAAKAQSEVARQAAADQAARLKAYRAFLGGKDGSSSASEYDTLIKRIRERIALSSEELSAGRELTESEKFAAKVTSDLAQMKTKLTAQQRAAIDDAMAWVKVNDLAVQVMRSEMDAAKALALARQAARQADDAAVKQALQDIEAERIASLKSVTDRVASLKDEAEAAKLAADLNVSLAEAVEMVAMARLQEKQQRLIEGAEAWEAVEREIAARRELLALIKGREELRQYQDMWASIDRTAHDVWVNIFDSGSNVFRKLGQTLKAAVLDVLYQMTVRKWVISIGASMGLPGAALATQSLSGLGSASSSIGLLGSLGGTFGTFGAGLNAGISGLFGEAGLMGTLSAGTTALGAGNIAGGLGRLLGPVGLVLGAAALLSKLASGGETRSGGQYNFGDLIAAPSGGELTEGGQAAALTAQGINSILASVGSKARLTNFMSGLESSKNGKGFAYAGGTLSTGAAFGQGWGAAFSQDGWLNRRGSMTPEQALTAFSEELKQATLQALQAATDVPESIARLLRGKNFDTMASAELDAVLSQVQAVIAEVDRFGAAVYGLPFEHLIERSFDLKAALMDAVGGADALAAKLAFVSQAYYTEAEQRQQAALNIQRALAGAGANFTIEQILGSDRGKFRQMLDYWGGRGDSAGQAIFAALLNVGQAFDQLHPAVQAVDSAIGDVTTVMLKAASDMMAQLERVAARERTVIQAQMEAAQAQAAAAEAVLRASGQAARQLYQQVEATRLMGGRQAQAFIAQALLTARTSGYLPDAGQLETAIQSATAGLGSGGMTKIDADFQRLVLAGQLQALAEVSQPQLSVAERAVQIAQDQLDVLDRQLIFWQDAIAIAEGQLDATLTWGAALQQMADAFERQFGVKPGTVVAAQAAAASSAAVFGGGGAEAVFGGGGGTSAEGLRYTLTALGIPIPAYDVGTPYVRGNQLALLHDGEEVLTREQARARRESSGVGSDEILAELRDLNQRMWRLEKQALRTANAVNGLGEAPMVVETTT